VARLDDHVLGLSIAGDDRAAQVKVQVRVAARRDQRLRPAEAVVDGVQAGREGAARVEHRNLQRPAMLVRGGLSVKAVAKLLGHANPNITLRTYAHLWPDDEDRSREAVDAVFRRTDVPTMRPRREA
jgi:integrase